MVLMRWGSASRIRGQSPDGWLMLGGVVAPERATLRWCGQRKDRRHFACTGEGQGIDFLVDDHASNIVVLVDPGLLRQIAGPEALDYIRAAKHLQTGVAGGRLVDLVVCMVNESNRRPLLLQQPMVFMQAYSSLLRALEESLAEVDPRATGVVDTRECAVHAAIEHVRQSSGRSSAWHMARAAGFCQKTLELAFRKVLRTTPGKYLVLTRLNAAHHELATAIKGQTTVTDVALRWGFTHLGRFSGEYQQLFDELPSQTLEKAADCT